jgi:hypothetical protein
MNKFIITLDIDWAPDFVIDKVASVLRASRVRATWFVTHRSAAVDRLREDPDLFELGIHPNFLPGSTHGNTAEVVLMNTLSIVPEAISVRTHGLFQSSHLLDEMIIGQTNLKVDSSLFLPDMPNIQPIEYRRIAGTLLRVPIFWADVYEMEKGDSMQLTPLLKVKGLKVMAFHPIYIYLNLSELKPYEHIRQEAPRLTELTATIADRYIQTKEGTQTFFRELVDSLSIVGESLCLRDIFTIWNDKRRE